MKLNEKQFSFQLKISLKNCLYFLWISCLAILLLVSLYIPCPKNCCAIRTSPYCTQYSVQYTLIYQKFRNKLTWFTYSLQVAVENCSKLSLPNAQYVFKGNPLYTCEMEPPLRWSARYYSTWSNFSIFSSPHILWPERLQK